MPDKDRAGLEDRVRELEELNQLACTLGSSLNVEETLSAIAETSLKLSGAERVALLLFGLTPGQEAQTLIRRSDSGEADIDHIVNVLAAQLILGKPESFLADDIIERIKLDKPSAKARNLGPALVVPLTVKDRPIGIINLVNSRGGTPLIQDALRAISLVATLAAQYIQRARLHSLPMDLGCSLTSQTSS